MLSLKLKSSKINQAQTETKAINKKLGTLAERGEVPADRKLILSRIRINDHQAKM